MYESYKILECNETASDDEIKKSFKRKAMKLHPDRGGNKDEFDRLVKAFVFIIEQRKKVNSIIDSKKDSDNFFKSFFGSRTPPYSGR